MSSVINREQLSGPVLQEFERMYAWLRAFLRQEHNDDGTHRIGQWASYDVQWSIAPISDPQPSIGNGALRGRYTRIGDTVHFAVHLHFGSTTDPGGGAGNIYQFSLPVPAVPSTLALFVGTAMSTNGNGVSILLQNAVYAQDNLSPFGVDYPTTWSAGQRFVIAGTYEAA